MNGIGELIGGDLPPDERDRLEHVHALLRQAGSPPELSPALERAPDPPKDRANLFPHRYRATTATAAVVAACVLFGLGYLIGGGADGRAPAETVQLAGANGASGTLDVFGVDAAGNHPLELRISGLPAGRYELWLTRGARRVARYGTFAVAPGETKVSLNAPFEPTSVDGWAVVPAGERAPALTT